MVLAYNLQGIDSLNLTIDHIVGMYNGTYTWWNDTSIQDVNPYAALPDREIRVRVY